MKYAQTYFIALKDCNFLDTKFYYNVLTFVWGTLSVCVTTQNLICDQLVFKFIIYENTILGNDENKSFIPFFTFLHLIWNKVCPVWRGQKNEAEKKQISFF